MTKTAGTFVMAALCSCAMAMLAGCVGSSGATAGAGAHAHAHDPGSHNHDRGRMMIASNGVVDALLTSHLSFTEGNELDVFVEKAGAPLALSTTRLEAQARVRGEARTLSFSCAPPEERPADEADGTCSHFVARAVWMSPKDRLEVATSLPLLTGDIDYTWRSFDPLRYAHHVD